MKTASKVWSKTKCQGLYRHSSKVYYARLAIAGQKTWRSLKTEILEVAKVEFDKLKRESESQAELAEEITVSEGMTVGEAIAARLLQIHNDPAIKPSTLHYWTQIVTALEKSWPGLGKKSLRRVAAEECEQWAGRYAKKASPTRFNNSLGFLRSVFELGIKRGVRRTNPTSEIKRVKIRLKDLSTKLPSREKFIEWVKLIRNRGGRFSKDSADYVEFLAYSGLRKGEADSLQWKHCDFARGEFIVEGDEEQGTKNLQFRRVPMTAAAKDLIKRIQERRTNPLPDEHILKVQEAQKAMDRAAEEIGMERITHHDLRHLFATVCIESGVDIPTVAKWLGHKDGGALAMKVYGHLRNEHSLAAATRVSFAA